MKLTTAVTPLIIAAAVIAAPEPGRRADFKTNVARGFRLVKTAPDVERWMAEEDILKLISENTRFMDVTDTYEDTKAVKESLAATTSTSERVSAVTYPSISHTAQVKPIISTLSISNMQTMLSSLTALNNRYYKASTGAQATTLIYNKLVSIAGSTSGISITQFTHSWGQNSVIAKFTGSAGGASTIFGAHLDSINLNSPTSGRAPGADDDGTGVVNLIEAFRALVGAGFKPSTPLEFHFNAAEEPGLLGSQAIAASYKKAGTQVKAYIQLDMTAYFQTGSKEVIALVSDYVDPTLNTFLRSVISAYCAIPAGVDECGYACSDHASWYELGYPTANPFEAPTAQSNPYIHTTSDTTSLSGFSWTHSLEFVKLVVGAAYELTA